MSKKETVAALRYAVNESNSLHASYVGRPDVAASYERFIELQMAYFLPRYDDLRDRPGYSEAIDFVVSDLTGTRIAGRDRELEKVVPLMTRVLPGKALSALATAMTLNARILKINLGIASILRSAIDSGNSVSERDYCEASRQHASISDFDELITMTRQAGESLARIVRLPMIGSLLRSMRLPARMAGVLDLHEFLERGLATFLALDDVPQFLDIMEQRMRVVFSHVFEAPLESLDAQPISSA
ncbi:MAG: hypothetical protein AAF290_12530 [Pseudomonadota bacterium]